MEQHITRKIASILTVALLFAQALLPFQAYAGVVSNGAASTPSGQVSTPLNYDNPNSGNNPYKPKVSDFLNAKLLSQVVGCTGIVNKVSDKVVGAVKKEANKLIDKAKKAIAAKVKTVIKNTVGDTVKRIVGGVIETALGATVTSPGSGLGTGAGIAVNALAEQGTTTKTRDQQAIDKADQLELDKKQADAALAEKVAKEKYRENCLNGIAINLAKNQLTSMTKSSMNWINTGFNGDPFFVKNVDSFMSKIEDNILEQETNMFKKWESTTEYPYGRDFARGAITSQQSTKDFASSMKQDLTSYLTPGATPESFANNFSQGGWGGWFALTQNDNNNPLGFTYRSAENIVNEQTKAVENQKAELLQNGGYLSQKKCVEYEKVDAGKKNPDGTPKQADCIKYETITPGSSIAAKVNTYINSPERQTELVKTMNDALNSLFSSLINRFEDQGLAGLSSSNAVSTAVADGGFSTHITFDEDGYVSVDDSPASNTTISSGGASSSGSSTQIHVPTGYTSTNVGLSVAGPYVQDDGFDITKDLGNTYDADGNLIKTGVIQNQYNYIDSMGVYKSVIADVLPALGELDYCIPGPNPNWRENSKEAIDEYLNSLNNVDDVANVGNTIVYAPEGTYEYPRPVPENPPKKKMSLFKKISLVVNPLAGMHYARKKFQTALERRKNESEREFVERDNARIRAQNDAIRKDMLEGKRPLDPIFIANTIGTDRDSVLKMIAPEGDAFDPAKLLATLDGFEEYVNGTYGLESPMQNYWKNNTQYLAMSQEGLKLTSGIPDYIDAVAEAKADSKDLLAEATPNLDKLKAIQKRVNEIIAAAQKRREEKRKNEGLALSSQVCLTKEKVTYMDYEGKIITTDTKPLPVIKSRDEVKQDYGGTVIQ